LLGTLTVALESDNIAEELLARHPDAVALVGYLRIRGKTAVVSADRAFTLTMKFALKDIVAKRQIPAEHAAAPAKQSVILVKEEVMRTPILQKSEREELAASFLTGPIGAEVLIPGTLEGAAYRLGVAYSIGCEIAECSIAKASPRC
jgi:hypothetical protein